MYEYPYSDEKGNYCYRIVGGKRIKIYENLGLTESMKASGKFVNYSDDEKYAINKYLSPYSLIINEKLRENKNLTQEEEKFVKNLDSYLEKAPNYNGTIVRTLDMPNANKFIHQLKIGEIYSTNQYLSFSTKEGYNSEANVKIYVQKCKSGKDLTKVNTIGENEVLYQRNVKFKTLNIISKDSIIYVLWEEA